MNPEEIEFGAWRTSSHSVGDGNCVKLAWAKRTRGVLGVQDSKWDGDGPAPTLVFPPAAAGNLRELSVLRPKARSEECGT